MEDDVVVHSMADVNSDPQFVSARLP